MPCVIVISAVRGECLDHVLIRSERHLLRVLKKQVAHFNRRPPQHGIGQRVPSGPVASTVPSPSGQVVALPVLGGLPHEYRWAA